MGNRKLKYLVIVYSKLDVLHKDALSRSTYEVKAGASLTPKKRVREKFGKSEKLE
jgi:hypothetical protein